MSVGYVLLSDLFLLLSLLFTFMWLLKSVFNTPITELKKIATKKERICKVTTWPEPTRRSND